jgi:hypothetical protein
MNKPIETRYKGYRFRSRLEARWAVFFDALGLNYQYEPEGFNLNNWTAGGKYNYLPDFLLYDHEGQPSAWVEIKPFMPPLAELSKLLELCRSGRHSKSGGINSVCDGFYLLGEPKQDEMCLWINNSHAKELKTFGPYDPNLFVMIQSELLFIAPFCTDKLKNIWKPEVEFNEKIREECGRVYNETVDAIFAKARSARFEFGERGI